MKIALWRILIAAGVAISACTAGYEALAPRISPVDGTIVPVGRWFAWPGKPFATYRVVSELPDSNLAAAGIAPGDTYVPDDSFLARWLIRPGESLPVTVFHDGVARKTTIVASNRVLPTDRLGWTIRIGRAIVQYAMLALALVIAWQLPDALWVRALSATLVLTGFSPWQGDELAFPGVWRCIAVTVEGFAVQAGICCGLLFAATLPEPPKSGFRIWLLRTLPLVFLLLAAGIVGMTFDLRATYVALPFRLLQAYCIIAIVATMSISAAEAQGQDRQRLRYLAWTFALGYSGFFVSVIALWFLATGAGGSYQTWSLPRLTLIAIPIGLAYGLLSHRVVSSSFIASRTLVYGALTSSLVPVFTVAEWAATNLFTTAQGKSAFFVGLTVIITASFKTIHSKVDKLFDKWIFRKQHESEKQIGKFTKEVPHLHDANILAERCVAVLDEHMAATGTALYIHAEPEVMADVNAAADYLRVATCGSEAPESIHELDPVVLSLKADGDAVESDLLGKGGHAFPMIARGHLTGFIALGPKRDGEILAPDEIKHLMELTHAVAVSLEAIRINDLESRLASAEAGRAELHRLLSDLVQPGVSPAAKAARKPRSVS